MAKKNDDDDQKALEEAEKTYKKAVQRDKEDQKKDPEKRWGKDK